MSERAFLRGGSPEAGSIVRQRQKGRPPAMFRLDDNYSQAESARLINAFVRDTVHSLETLRAANDELIARLEALENGGSDAG